ncbi:MAG: wax ester/triacylglycerol synthase family O-acyltransferase [Gammaproteobacteria bacterium]|nr:wax ester/triacylglycerol synthase family O-acyltransferase [Gammaproteobacteria bacterium]
MQQLTGMDASFLYFETPNQPMHIGALAVYDPSTAPGAFVRFKDVLGTIESRLHMARTFRERVVRVPLDLDHPYWVRDADFDLEFHVRHIALPKPGDWRQLCIQTARLHARPLDTTKPLWEFYVIEGLDHVQGLPPGSFAIVSKIHHAAIDGVSGAEITGAIHDLEPNASVAPPEQPWSADRDPLAAELMIRAWANNLRQPFHFARVMANTVPAIGRVAAGWRNESFKIPAPVPRTRFNRTISPHRVVDGRSFPLAKIRRIKSAVDGATVNDAVLSIVGGALRRYLMSKNELPVESLVAMAPISVRAKDQSGAMGNQVAAMAAQLRSDIGEPIARLQAVHEGTVQSKALTEAVGARLMTDYSQFIPSSLAGLAARLYTRAGLANRVRPIFNCVVTNIPGPQQSLYMGGARLITQYGLGPIVDGMALIHPVFSYCGEITISFTSCREIMPDPEFYAECIEASYEEMCEAAGIRDEAPPPSSVVEPTYSA